MSNYSIRQHLIELLSDFAEYISDEVCEDKEIGVIVSSVAFSEQVEKILSDMEQCCSLDIEKSFKELIKNFENSDFDLGDFEATIEDIISAIERISYRNSNQYEDGISLSDSYDFSVSIAPVSGVSKSTFTPVVKTTVEDKNVDTSSADGDVPAILNLNMHSWIKQDYLLSYLQFVAENRKYAWTALDQSLGKQIAIAVGGSLVKGYFPADTDFAEGFSYFSNFDVVDYKQYVLDHFGEDIELSEDEKKKEFVLIYNSLSAGKRTFNLLTCVSDFTEEFASQTLNIRQAAADGDYDSVLRKAIISNAQFYADVTDSDIDKEHIFLSYAKFNSYFYMLRLLIRMHGNTDQADILTWCASLRKTCQAVARRLAYYSLKKIEVLNPVLAEAIKKAEKENPHALQELVGIKPNPKKSVYDLTIYDLDFSTPTINCLRRANVLTVRDILNMTAADLVKIKSLGRRSQFEIIIKLKELGLSLKETPPDNPSFRTMLNSLCIVLNDKSSIAFLGAKMPSTIKSNSVLAYCYFDNTFGISFQILGLTYYEDGDYTLVWTQDDTGLTARGDTYENLQIIVIKNKALENRFANIIASRRSTSFWTDDDLGKTRKMDCLDQFRHFSHPDDILIHIINYSAGKQEKIWAKVRSYVGVINNEDVFLASLLNEPFDSCFNMHSGDNILVVRRKVQGDDYILMGVKQIDAV